MPYTVGGDPTTPGKSTVDWNQYNFDYDYPDDLDLKPDSELHNFIRTKIYQRARESRNEMAKRFDSWREIDKTMTVYIPTSDKEKATKDKDSRKPISIVYPHSYATLESLLTYMMMAFIQDPIFRYEGVEDEDTIGAMLMELVVKVHCIKSKVPLAIHTVLRDSLCYGVGVGIPGWRKVNGRVPIKSSVVTESELGSNIQNQVTFVDKLIFEGNDLSNIDPYMWLPDPSVSSDNIQSGEFIGWVERDNIMNMLSEEANSGGEIFNVKYLKKKKGKLSTFALDQSERNKKFGGSPDTRKDLTNSTNPVDNIKMYINIIPKDWKLGSSEYPEKWFFCLSADEVITQAYRADHNHGMYPIGVASPEYDGYSITPISKMEVISGMQGVLDFLFNSHIANVRKSINDMLVVDPYLININDLKDPEPGKIIRTRRPAWGHGVKGAVEQLRVDDITRANMGDAGYIANLMDKIVGTDASMQGAQRQGGPERLTKGEFQGTRGSAVSRLQRTAMIIGLQFMQDIGTMFAVHTQQYMTQNTVVGITGQYEQQLKGIYGKEKSRVAVSPIDLAIATDLIVRDGSVPGGNFSEAWLQMFSTIGGSPELMQQFDITRIFMYIAQQLGAKNVEDFRRKTDQMQPQVLPDEQVSNQAQAGNLIPAGDL